MVAASIVIRIFEKKLGRLAKYLYISIMPVFGAVVIFFANDGKFGAMILFPKSYLKMDSLVIWIFIGIVYVLALLVAVVITTRTYELKNIVTIKDDLLVSMKKLESISEQAAERTAEISTSTGEQVAGVEKIIHSMENVQNGIEHLSVILNNR